MKISLVNGKSKEEDINLSKAIYGNVFNQDLVHQAVVSFLAGGRQGSHKQKNRSDVRGGGRKPFRQKGTGRARAGTIRSPLWRGGGVAFASSNRDYSKKINKKMYRAAIRSILSELYRQERIVALAKPTLKAPKTKEMVKVLKENKLERESILFILDEIDLNLHLSARNIPNVEVATVKEINPVLLLRSDRVVIVPEAFKLIEDWVR